MPQPTAAPSSGPTAPAQEVRSLKDLSPQQWKSGIAAWLGWLFDGLDMHLYGLVALPFVTALVMNQYPTLAADAATAMAKDKAGIIQAAFLFGWALGGGFFGRVGDLLGRSRTLSLTILTYACFTGLAFFAHTWWQLLIFRFLAALGIGGEWAVGSALLSETWPRRWRPWIAAVLQTGVNLGVLLACLTTYLATLHPDYHPKWVFLVGVVPAFLVFWIRRHVPEPAEWHAAKNSARDQQPGIAQLFAPGIRRTTLLTIIVCACGLTAWWAFMFWHAQHLRSLPELNDSLVAKYPAYLAQFKSSALTAVPATQQKWVEAEKQKVVSIAFFLIIGISIVGNFFASFIAKKIGYRRAIAVCYAGFFIAMIGTFCQPRGWESLVWVWFPFVGFFSGVFGLFTMYLPPLFPTLLRTTGAGFCYNIGRIASALGVGFSGWITSGVDFRTTLLYAGFLYLPALVVALILPEPPDEAGPAGPLET
ncbi:MAG: MFS transporter [Verrucomicrobia bacterium]|nr:MFS transporter [Verrucomicrobiota bacterium]